MSTREDLIAGLRAVADFYETHPDMPVPLYPSLLVGCSNIAKDDTAAAELVNHAAALLGTPVEVGDHTSTERQFHGLGLRVYATTRASQAAYKALMSYADVVQPEGGEPR